MSVLSIADYVNLVQMNAARTHLAYQQIRAQLDALDDPRLDRILAAALVASGRVEDLTARRRAQGEVRSEDGDAEFDTVADAEARRLVKAIRETYAWMVRTRHSLRSRLRRLVMTHCPVGPGDIISQRYEEQLRRTEALVVALRGEYADLVDVIECERKLRAVEATIPAYADALAARHTVTAGDVRAASRVMHEHTAVVVAYVIGTYHADPDVMEALLLPIADQQARIRAILKARRAGESVSDDPSRDDDDLIALDAADDDPDGLDGLDGLDGIADVDAAADGAAEDAPERRAPEGPLVGNPDVNLPVFTPIDRAGPDADG